MSRATIHIAECAVQSLLIVTKFKMGVSVPWISIIDGYGGGLCMVYFNLFWLADAVAKGLRVSNLPSRACLQNTEHLPCDTSSWERPLVYVTNGNLFPLK